MTIYTIGYSTDSRCRTAYGAGTCEVEADDSFDAIDRAKAIAPTGFGFYIIKKIYNQPQTPQQ